MADAQDPRSEFYRKALHVRDVRPTISTGAYANGDAVGGLITLSSVVHFDGGGSYLHSITVIDESAQDTGLSFVFFSAQPTASTFTDNGAVSIHADDRDKILGVVAAEAADYFPVGSGLSVASLRTQGLALQSDDAANDIWVAVIANEAGTYAATNDLIFRFGIAQG